MNIRSLIAGIQTIHKAAQHHAFQQVDYSVTLRNWIIGAYIVEFEQRGAQRAKYRDNLLDVLAERLNKIPGLGKRNLYLFKSFYIAYPQILQTVSAKSRNRSFSIINPFSVPVSGRNSNLPILQTLSAKSLTRKNQGMTTLPVEVLLNRLSFSHFIELLKVDSESKRVFYEIQSIRNNWSVRELRRSIETLLYERTGLSAKKRAIISKAKEGITEAEQIIKSPYILEFLGLEQKPEFNENDLEQSIINHLQKFLVEMGRGFCFESRQKRISFDNKHYFIDLVFYHRILKCHVLVDLKIGAFDHSDAGQMNMYLNYFREEEMSAGDTPPIGIILCADKNESLVKYATGGLSKKIFVGKYLVALPSESELKRLIQSDTKHFLKKKGNRKN